MTRFRALDWLSLVSYGVTIISIVNTLRMDRIKSARPRCYQLDRRDAVSLDQGRISNQRHPVLLTACGMRTKIASMARFLMVGLVNTGFGYACYAVFIIAGASLWLAVAGTTTLALLFNFASYGRIVFVDARLRILPRFAAFYAVLAILNFALLKLAVRLDAGPLFAQAMLLPMLAAFSYLGMKRFVFVGDATASSV